MKVVIDHKIPFIKEVIEQIADEVVYLPGSAFTPETIKDADALIVRTRTRCNRALLEGSQVKFIATATIGYDHIDTHYCEQAGIAWRNAPGCNSGSVAQYLQAVLLLLQKEKGMILDQCTIGIVGVGNVGSKVAQVARELGMKVILCDPPRAQQGDKEPFSPLCELAKACDIITFHVPLIDEGDYKTRHMANETFMESLAHCRVLINTSRGEVVDGEALLKALHSGKIAEAVLDVWEQEPEINRALLEKVYLGTPHIAGYSADGKANATRMSLEALCNFFGIEREVKIEVPPPHNRVIYASTYEEAYLQMYDPRRDSNALKQHPELFEKLRGDYPLRREKEAFSLVIAPR